MRGLLNAPLSIEPLNRFNGKVLPGVIWVEGDNRTGSLTAPGASNTKGAYTELITSTADEYDWISMSFAVATAAAAVDTGVLLDIAIGAAGSEVVIVPDLQIGWAELTPTILIPVHIPKGSRVAARYQRVGAGGSIRPVTRYGKNASYRRSPSHIVTHGTTAASSKGTSLTGGATNTESAWTEIVAATTEPYCGFFVTIGGDSDTTQLTTTFNIFDIGIGASGSEIAIASDIPVKWSSNENFIFTNTNLIVATHIPKGTRIAARWTRTNTGDSADLSFHGIPV